MTLKSALSVAETFNSDSEVMLEFVVDVSKTLEFNELSQSKLFTFFREILLQPQIKTPDTTP